MRLVFWSYEDQRTLLGPLRNKVYYTFQFVLDGHAINGDFPKYTRCDSGAFFFNVFILFVCFVCFPLCICLKKRKTDKKRKGNSHLTPQLVRISTSGPKQLYSQFYSYHRWLSPWSRKLKHGWYLASPWEPSWSHITAAGHSGHEAAMRKTTGGRGRYFRRSSKSALLTLHTHCEGSCIRLLVLQTSLNKDIGCMV